MSRAYLGHAKLESADLSRAILPFACLLRAELQGANMEGADLTKGILMDAKLDLPPELGPLVMRVQPPL